MSLRVVRALSAERSYSRVQMASVVVFDTNAWLGVEVLSTLGKPIRISPLQYRMGR